VVVQAAGGALCGGTRERETASTTNVLERVSERACEQRRAVWGWKRGGSDEEKNEDWRERQRGGGSEERGSGEYFHTPDSRRR